MKIYVATKWEERFYARQVMDALVAAGHTITYDWTHGEQISREQAELDKRGVMTADALVVIAERDLAYKGTYVEFGIAVARGIPIYIEGNAIDGCIFTKLPEVRRGITSLLIPKNATLVTAS